MTEKSDCRWNAPAGPDSVMVVDSAHVVREAMRDGVGLDDLVQCHCVDCQDAVFVTPADVLEFHKELDEWPAQMLCPPCHARRQEREREKEQRQDELLRMVGKAELARMRTRDPVDRAQAGMLGAMAELEGHGLMPALAVCVTCARNWGVELEALASAAEEQMNKR